MAKGKRNLYVGKKVYVIDYSRLRDSSQSYVTTGTISNISYDTSIVKVIFKDEKYHCYRISDFGKMIFCTKNAAYNLLREIPKVDSFVYEISKSNNVVKRKVENLNMHIRMDSTLLLGITLSGKHVDNTIYDIGKSFFSTQSAAHFEAMKRKKIK